MDKVREKADWICSLVREDGNLMWVLSESGLKRRIWEVNKNT